MKLILMYINMVCFIAAPGVADNALNVGFSMVQSYQESSLIGGLVVEKGTGLPVENVIVRWKGTSHAELTDADGSYRISGYAGSRKLVFSKPGWIDKKVRVRNRSNIDIRIKKIKWKPVPVQPDEDLPHDTILIFDPVLEP